MTQTQRYESGATSHAVNDLILMADNTPETAELRDSIYKLFVRDSGTVLDQIPVDLERMKRRFMPLIGASINAYRKAFPNLEDHSHVRYMSKEQKDEFCQLYVDDFNTWKKEHGYKS